MSLSAPIPTAYPTFDPDQTDRPALALQLDFKDYALEVPVHSHRKAQLVLALHGAVTCEVDGAVWIVPPRCGVWIPSNVPHSNIATPNARLSYLFVEPSAAAALPDACCTLSVSPLVREMIQRLATFDPEYEPGSHADLCARTLLGELAVMQKEQLHLPVSAHPKIKQMIDGLASVPHDRSTIGQWATRLAMSERSLARLMVTETGLPFGRWRQQFQLLVALREWASGASVQNVSEYLGYESVTAFITMFKKALGQTPGRYLAER